MLLNKSMDTLSSIEENSSHIHIQIGWSYSPVVYLVTRLLLFLETACQDGPRWKSMACE